MIFGQKSYEPNQIIESCESTNDIVKDFGRKNHPHGTWIASEIQKDGRGRMGREWVSQKGNIHLSVLARVQDLELWTWVPLMTAVAVAEILQKKFPDLPVQIKWPNDLLVNGAKLGGILVESLSEGSNRFLVIGLGLNCLLVPPVKDRKVTSLTQEMGRVIHASEILDDLRFWLTQRIGKLAKLTPAQLKDEFLQYSFHQPGDTVEWKSDKGQFKGVFLGLGDQGELLLQSENQTTIRLLSEELSV